MRHGYRLDVLIGDVAQSGVLKPGAPAGQAAGEQLQALRAAQQELPARAPAVQAMLDWLLSQSARSRRVAASILITAASQSNVRNGCFCVL